MIFGTGNVNTCTEYILKTLLLYNTLYLWRFLKKVVGKIKMYQMLSYFTR